MFGIWRRGVAVVVPAVVTILLATPAHGADDSKKITLDDHIRTKVSEITTPRGKTQDGVQPLDGSRLLAADFHPETERWTERNNRIKISAMIGGFFPSGEMRILPSPASGVRVAWEVPGFISIRFDTMFSTPNAYLKVRNVDAQNGLDATGNRIAGDRRRVKGYYGVTSMSIGIFNPELSVASNLAMWAGFGIDVWYYHFHQQLDQDNDGGTGASSISRKRYEYDDANIGGHIFFDLQYRISDIFHVGFGFREHIVYARQTRTGLFYDVQGTRQGSAAAGGVNSRREDFFNDVPLSLVTEIQITISVLF